MKQMMNNNNMIPNTGNILPNNPSQMQKQVLNMQQNAGQNAKTLKANSSVFIPSSIFSYKKKKI